MPKWNYFTTEEKDLSLTWFYDELPEEYRRFRREAAPVEREYQELRQLLAAARQALAHQADNPELQARVAYLEKRLRHLESKFPWLTSDIALEYALWGVPH